MAGQLMRSGQGPAPLPMPPGMVSPFAFASGTQQGMGQSVAPGLAMFNRMAPSALQGPSSAPMPMADASAPQASNAGSAPAASPFMGSAGNSSFPMPPSGRSADAISRDRAMAQALLKSGTDASPVQSWTQGAARAMQGISGALYNDRANRDEKANQKANREFLVNLLGGGGSSANPTAGAAATPNNNPAQAAIGQTAGPAGQGAIAIEAAKRAIAKVESDGSGGYAAIGPVTRTGDRAYGKYQVMGANIPQWTQAALGYSMTPQQFRNSPEAQEKVFEHRFGGYLQHYGNLRDAASVWFSGRPFAGNNSSDGYNTVPEYVRKVENAARQLAGQQGAPAPQMPAQPGAPQAPAPAMGGAPMPQQGIAPRAPGIAGMDPQRLLLAAAFTNDPNMKQTLGALAQMQAQQGKVQYQTLPDGTILALDPSNRRPPTPVYQASTKPTFGVIGKDQSGNEQYGFIDPVTRQVQPAQLPQQQQGPQVITDPSGRQIPVPQGLGKEGKKAFEKGVGDASAKSVTSAPASFDMLNNVYGQIKGIMDNPGQLEAATGQFAPITRLWRGGDTRKGDSRIETLRGQAFLAAREALKGGGQITDFESKRAEAAMARLQDTGIGTPEFKVALKEFHDAVLSGMTKLKQLPGMEGRALPKPINFGPAPPAAGQRPQAGKSDPLSRAREAISQGAPREKVIERLRQNGIDPGGL